MVGSKRGDMVAAAAAAVPEAQVAHRAVAHAGDAALQAAGGGGHGPASAAVIVQFAAIGKVHLETERRKIETEEREEKNKKKIERAKKKKNRESKLYRVSG